MTQDVFEIVGGTPLRGEMEIQGAKNSVLPILAATVLCRGECVLENVPILSDVETAEQILRHLGCTVKREDHTLIVDSSLLHASDIPDHLMSKMRSSVFFLGAILGAVGECTMSCPGGCELGPRPIDLHLSALGQMGTVFCREGQSLRAEGKKLHGATVTLSFPSVGATENILLAACGASGTTRIINAAKEPEIADLAGFLQKAGAEIYGAGSSLIEIRGRKPLHPAAFRIMPDRIVTATWLCAGAATGGELGLKNADPSHLRPVLSALSQAGCGIREEKNSIRLKAPERLRAGGVYRTEPYPGFPTDAQAILMACLCKAEGVSVFTENIFSCRYRHANELQKMGARIRVEGRNATVWGVERLAGARVAATDLRGGAALLVAALAAEGKSFISHINHIDRGYENVVQLLTGGEAKIRRIPGCEKTL